MFCPYYIVLRTLSKLVEKLANTYEICYTVDHKDGDLLRRNRHFLKNASNSILSP